MPNGVVNRLERFLATGAGARFLEEAEYEAAAKEAAVRRRRELATEMEELHRRRKEVIPALRLRVREAEEDYERAREAEIAARRKRSESRNVEFNEDFAIRNEISRVEIALARSADPRILAAIEEAVEVLRTWSETRKNLLRWRSEKATSWDGTDTWVKRYGTNEAGVDALEKGVEDARAAMRKLALVPELGDETIEAAVANLRAAIEACHRDPPPVVMQRFDHRGQPVGEPVELPMAK